MKKFFSKILLLIFLLIAGINSAFAFEETLIILDASLSMADVIGDVPKYQIAVEAVKRYLSNTKPSDRIGLRLIGLQINQKLLNFIQNPDALCQATNLINPISDNNAQNIINNLSNIFPLGVSPLTYSIKIAIDNDFSPYSTKHIILITDGAESCNQDPCSYAQQVMSHRKDVKIDIIAIDVTTGDLVQLQCITQATGGNVYNIKTDNEFNSAFNKVTTQYQNVSRSKVNYKNYMIEVSQ